MRLTLRTLLAYRDRVLPAGELEQLHGRVQQSVLASNLIKRIDALGQRTNLLAPPIEGKGLGADANTIAEYLDDSLGGDKVPELERICLESDVQLAELAQCHGILSELRSATVDVPTDLRHSILRLHDPQRRAEVLAMRQTQADSRPKARPVHDPQPPADHQVSPAAAALVASERFHLSPSGAELADSAAARAETSAEAALATGASATGALATGTALSSPMVASGGDSIRTRGLDLEGAHLAHEVPEYLRGRTRDGWLGPLAIGGLVALLCLLVWRTVGSWNSVREMLAVKETGTPSTPIVNPAPSEMGAPETKNGRPTAGANAAGQPVPSETGQPSPQATSASQLSPQEIKADQTSALAAVPGALPMLVPNANSTATTTSPQPAPETGADAASPKPDPTSPPTSSPQSVAQWLPADEAGGQAVILVHLPEHDLWRLQPAEHIYAGSQIFIPPFMRPKLDLNDGSFWLACGLTHMTLELTSEQGPRIELQLGRGQLSSTGSSPIQLATPAGQVQLALADAQSQLAVELSYPPLGFGSVTDRQVHPPVLTLTAIAGTAQVEMDGTSLTLESGKSLSISGQQLAESQPTSQPSWLDASSERAVDLLAAQDLAKQLAGAEPIGTKLIALSTNRRPEMRALAAQTLALLGSWDWVSNPKTSLNEVRDRSFWTPTLVATRHILAAHPENLPGLQAALTSLDATTAQWRLNMWLGLSAGQLQSEGLNRLANSLESAALLERILAIYQLERATGKTLGFQPAEPNRAVTQAWSRELTSGRTPVLAQPNPEL